MATRFELIAEAPLFRMGAFGPVAVALYDGGANIEGLKLLDQRQAELVTRHPRLFTFSVVRGAVLKPPPGEVRELAAQLQGKYAAQCTGAAVIFDVNPLAAVVARGFMVGLSLIAPPSMNQKTFKKLKDAVAWARTIPGQVPEAMAPDLTEAIELFLKG